MKTRFIRLNKTVSTNTYIKSVEADTDEMLVVTAQEQTNGRGQGSNSWESEPQKNLLFSALIHPRFMPVQHQFLLSMAVALALKQTLDKYTGGIRIKWPNDIYWNDRKISGTLIETRLAGGQIRDFIFGTGLNLNQRVFLSDAPNPVSLCHIIGREVTPETVLQSILTAFDDYYSMLEAGEYEKISTLYHKGLYRSPGFYFYRDDDGLFEAEIVRVNDDGRIFLKDRSNETRCYEFKQVKAVIDNNIV